jgi:hypothetical protein
VPGWVLGGPRHVRVGHAALVFVVRLHCPGRKPRKRVVKRLRTIPRFTQPRFTVLKKLRVLKRPRRARTVARVDPAAPAPAVAARQL